MKISLAFGAELPINIHSVIVNPLGVHSSAPLVDIAPPLALALLFLKTQPVTAMLLQPPGMYNAPPFSALPFTNVMPSRFTLLTWLAISTIPDLPSPSKTVPSLPIRVMPLPMDMALFRLLVYVIPFRYNVEPASALLIAL